MPQYFQITDEQQSVTDEDHNSSIEQRLTVSPNVSHSKGNSNILLDEGTSSSLGGVGGGGAGMGRNTNLFNSNQSIVNH